MTLDPSLLIYLVVFVAVIVIVEGLYLTVFGKSISLNSRISRRLALMEQGGNREQVMEQLRKEMRQHLASRRVPIYALLASKAQRANIAFSPKQLILIMVVLALASFVVLGLATKADFLVRLGLAPVMGVGGVYMWVNKKAKKRMALLEEQLPDAIELMVRSLRVGHPFVSAISAVAKEIPDPLGSEFGLIADEAAYGRNVADSLKSFAERMDSQDLRFLAVAVGIQQQAGGNLAEVLDGLSKVIRSRFKLFRRVKAITAEAKWSGMFLSGFPIVSAVGLQVLKPDFYDGVKDTPYFMPCVGIVGVFLVANYIYMNMMVNIKV